MLPIPTTAMLAMTPSAFVDVTAPGSEMCVQRASSGGGGGHETRFGLDHPATHPTGGLASRGVRRSRLNFPAPTGFLCGQLPAAPIEPPTWLNLVEALLPKSVMA